VVEKREHDLLLSSRARFSAVCRRVLA